MGFTGFPQLSGHPCVSFGVNWERFYFGCESFRTKRRGRRCDGLLVLKQRAIDFKDSTVYSYRMPDFQDLKPEFETTQ